MVANALSRKTVDNPTVKARKREDRTIVLILPEDIKRLAAIWIAPGDIKKLAAKFQIAAIATTPSESLRRADLVDLIRTENIA